MMSSLVKSNNCKQAIREIYGKSVFPMTMDAHTKGYPITDEDRKRIHNKDLCGFCNNVVRKAIQTPCGHRYCFECIEREFVKGVAICRVCQEPLTRDKIFRDKFADREIQFIILCCIYSVFGCKWKGKLCHREEHHKTCKFIPLKCVNRECDKHVTKDNLAHHLQDECLYREVLCSFCEQPVTFNNLKEHEGKCPSFPVPCEHCGKQFPRSMIKDHLNTSSVDVCESLIARCPYVKVGCKENMPKNHDERAIHFQRNIQDHLNLLFGMFVKFLPLLEDLVPVKPNGKKAKLPHLLQSVCDEALSQINSLYQGLEERIKQIEGKYDNRSAMVHTGQNGIIKPDLIRRLDNSDAKTADLEFLLNEAHNTIEDLRQELTKTNVRFEKAEDTIRKLEKRMEELENVSGIRNVAVADLEEKISSSNNSSSDGILVWKIDQVAKRRAEASSGRQISFYSKPFYTDPQGYKMCARIYLEGDGMGKGNHISLFFVVMRGEYDALLKWPFRQKVTMMLLDQDNEEHVIDAFRPDPTSSSFQRPKGAMNIASGCPMFCPHSELQRHAYIRDDVMFIKIIVDRPDWK